MDLAAALRVLVVDDSSEIRRRVVEVLSQVAGVARVEEATGAAAATDLMKDSPMDVVVLDIHMPGGSGIDLLRQIKATSPSPVAIMLTNLSGEPYRRVCQTVGADAFLDKSTGLDPLVEIVQRLANGEASSVLRRTELLR